VIMGPSEHCFEITVSCLRTDAKYTLFSEGMFKSGGRQQGAMNASTKDKSVFRHGQALWRIFEAPEAILPLLCFGARCPSSR
jgi:hypothetical protein